MRELLLAGHDRTTELVNKSREVRFADAIRTLVLEPDDRSPIEFIPASVVTLSGVNISVNMFELAGSPGGPISFRLIVPEDVTVSSLNVSEPCVRTGGPWAAGSILVLENHGVIAGFGVRGGLAGYNDSGGKGDPFASGGGGGGAGIPSGPGGVIFDEPNILEIVGDAGSLLTGGAGGLSIPSPDPGATTQVEGDGSDGGDSLEMEYSLTIENTGFIFGGGGGGGGGSIGGNGGSGGDWNKSPVTGGNQGTSPNQGQNGRFAKFIGLGHVILFIGDPGNVWGRNIDQFI